MIAFKATVFFAAGLCLLATYMNGAESKEEIKVYKRLIPADVLRGSFINFVFNLFFCFVICMFFL